VGKGEVMRVGKGGRIEGRKIRRLWVGKKGRVEGMKNWEGLRVVGRGRVKGGKNGKG